MSLSADAKKLFDLLPDNSWMTQKTLAKALGCRTSKIKILKDELEAAGVIKILFHRNGKRANPRHELIKTPRNGNPICKHISRSFCLGDWWHSDRNQMIECYLRTGWNILPFAPHAKRPVEGFSATAWKRLPLAAKLDYFFDNPHLNVGLVVSPQTMVVDVDTKSSSWIQHENFRNTLTVSTPRGFHFYFRNDAIVTTSAKVLPDIDTRCKSNYVVLPPSINQSNESYWWETISLPNNLPIEFRRAWRDREFENRKQTGNFTLPTVIEEGTRNHTLWRYGRSLKCKDKNFHEIEATLIDCNHTNCSPPLSMMEMESLIENVWTRPNKASFLSQK